MDEWRFDQGRLDYFQFDEIKKIATALAEIDGIQKSAVGNDAIRENLKRYTSRPFLPTDYTVWRNYKRVFGCLMLAADIQGMILCTDLCRKLADPNFSIDSDEYLFHFCKSFYYPSPVFEGYERNSAQTFPGVAILKLLLAKFLTGEKSCISLDEIGEKLVANRVTGVEPVEFYVGIKGSNFNGNLRQARELVKFISQFSFLKWENPYLHLELCTKEDALRIEKMLTPRVRPDRKSAPEEILHMGDGFLLSGNDEFLLNNIFPLDAEFAEGSRVRSIHLRTERSGKLKELYFGYMPDAHICRMCTMDTLHRYPWADRLIELHHLLPLCSPLRVEKENTSVKDVVGLCPSCHRATHRFYARWLKRRDAKDFSNSEEARLVFAEAAKEIVLA